MSVSSPKVLVCWIGGTDLRAAESDAEAGSGPIAQAAQAETYDRLELLCNYPRADGERYAKWLQGHVNTEINLHHCPLTSPISFREIYLAVKTVLESLRVSSGARAELVFHLSPGTPSMASVWILLAKTSYPARLIQSSVQEGVRDADLPFDIAAEFVPEVKRVRDTRVTEGAEGKPLPAAEFADIVHRGPEMRQVISLATKAAGRAVPVLIEGESGTGKELLAKAMHQASPRAGGPFIAVNCGAVPAELFESEFFGHKKGAFTGATDSRKGHFEQAHEGTLFLDEIGELPGPAQVKILRAIQEGEIVPVGESRGRKVDVRIIAATNRSLADEVAEGRFREDLFYRLAVAVIKLPALRERKGDLTPLMDSLLDHVNKLARSEPGHVDKKLSVGAKKLMLEHPWPGNVRELLNTLLRAVVWSDGEQITAEAMRAALLVRPLAKAGEKDILNQALGGGFRLEDVMGEVARHYLARAVAEAQGSKTKATELVGFANYQTLSNWLKRYGLER